MASASGTCGGTDELALHVATHSNCPNSHWHDSIRGLLEQPRMAILNVGANKGYNLVEYVQRYSTSNLTKGRWKYLLEHEASPPCSHQCGSQCANALRRRERLPKMKGIALSLHAFEAMPANVKMLRQLVAATGLSATVHGVAVGNLSSASLMVPVLQSGSEKAAVSLAEPAGGYKVPMQRVPATSIDAFLDAQRIERAQLVSIDVEGFDGLVLQGMARALAARRVDVLEFEYSTKWQRVAGPDGLRHATDRLLAAGYPCFWQDNRGELSEASGRCWRERSARFAPGKPPFRNLVCSHRADVLAAFRKLDVATTCTRCETCLCARSSLDCKESCAALARQSG